MLGEFTGKPLQAFDLREPLIRPIATGRDPLDLSTKVPQGEENARFRPFQSEVIYESRGRKTPQPLKEYLKVAEAPYYHHAENDVFALNLPKFMAKTDEHGRDRSTHVDGRIGTVDAQGVNRSKEAEFIVPRTDILRNVIAGKRLTDVPPPGPRPETFIERAEKEAIAAEAAACKARKPKKIVATEEEPRVQEVSTPQKGGTKTSPHQAEGAETQVTREAHRR